MSYTKLSTKDWRSPALMLVNVTERPKSKGKVITKCSKCDIEQEKVFSELIRSMNRQFQYTDAHVCSPCLHSLPEYRKRFSENSKKVIDKIMIGSSERSTKLWEGESFRKRAIDAINQFSQTQEFRDKCSIAIRQKFDNDPEYRAKVQLARQNYWSKDDYRSDRTWSLSQFIDAANKEHTNKYDYTLVKYVNFKTKIDIICPKHGIFRQRPSHHIFYGNGCPKCALEVNESKPQKQIIKWLEDAGCIVESNNKSEIELELDIYIASHRLAIEYHGGYWHSYGKTETNRQRNKHNNKTNLAQANGISLIQIFDIEWTDKQSIVKSIILNKLNKSTRIFARKCTIKKISSKQAREFFNSNHLAGSRGAHIYYGLFLCDQLVSAMSLYRRDNVYELMRFCHLINHTVVGGLSKMLKHAINNDGINNIFTYADRRYSEAVGYKKVGFKLELITKPGYYYWRNNKIYNRIKFQKHKLSKLLTNFDPTKTECENMFLHGYRRIWDAGHYRLRLEA